MIYLHPKYVSEGMEARDFPGSSAFWFLSLTVCIMHNIAGGEDLKCTSRILGLQKAPSSPLQENMVSASLSLHGSLRVSLYHCLS